MNELREECGIFGVYGKKTQDVAELTYYGLYALQHRGQESCGIVVNDDGVFNYYKDTGLLTDVFTKTTLKDLGTGQIAVGHVRYGTTGNNDRLNSQPIVVNHHKGNMALAHNGNLVNAYELRKELELEGSIFHTTSDTEVISYIITKERIHCGSIEEAVTRAIYRLDGAFSLVVMSPQKMIAVRDPYGFRPLCYGIRPDGTYIVASETCALDVVGAEYIRDLDPGEVLIFSPDGVRSIREHCNTKPHKICIFEYLYFARPDSVIEGKSVHVARVRAGRELAREHPAEADVVIGVPDSGLDAAIGYAEESGIPYKLGFVKNKYIGRTFIAPGQANRVNKVRIKLNPIVYNIAGKRVVLVDDSIVRGTTITRIVEIIRNAGAKEVHVRSSAPPFTDPCYYGTDVDNKEFLIACQYSSMEEIANAIGADSIGYLSTERLYKIIGAEPGKGYCCSCFTGQYPTSVPTGERDRFEIKRSEVDKEQENEQPPERKFIDYIRD